MIYNSRRILIIFLIIIISIISTFSQYLISNDKIDSLTNNNIINSEIIDIKLDNFVKGNINNGNPSIYYRLNILNDSEEIFFDYQSEYGCLYINIENDYLNNSNISDYEFCSNGINNIFNLSKNNIIKIIGDKPFVGLNITINVSYSSSELNNNFDFNYSLKVSLRKKGINIFEINPGYKVLCSPEKINEDNYRCIFILVNNSVIQNDNNLIIYSSSSKNMIKTNIFVDYINKDKYDKWDIEYLSNNIPNVNSTFNNKYKEIDFIKIPELKSDKYIYISVESKNKENIEIITQIINEEIRIPEINDIKIYSINKSISNIMLYFNDLLVNEISLTLVTLYGKASIYLGNDESTEYITDINENKLIFMINLNSCKSEDCKLKINNFEDDEYIFYIYYTKKTNNILNELIYGKSNKIIYNDFKYPMMLYEQISNYNSSININLQLFNIQEINTILNNNNFFDIEIIIVSQKDIYELKLNYTHIKSYNNKIKRKFDPVLSAANIYLTNEEIKSFNISEDSWIVIYISNNTNMNNIERIILGSIISTTNDLIIPSERIYHYGQLGNEERIVYKLKGKEDYHLMRLIFSCNSEYIGWSIRKTNDFNDYMKNDTNLGFVTEKWNNGRELLTMYKENGEDIYLSIFYKDKRNIDLKLANYIFKYINSAKNNFKNYIIKNDSINYNTEQNTIIINGISPSPSNITYYLKIVYKEDYVKNETINTIAISESNSNIIIKGENNDNNNIVFILNNIKNNIYYINAYSIIIEKNYDIEYLSYSGLIIKDKIKTKISHKNLILSSLIIGALIILIIFIRIINYCRRKRNRRRNDSFLRGFPDSESDDDSVIIEDDLNSDEILS